MEIWLSFDTSDVTSLELLLVDDLDLWYSLDLRSKHFLFSKMTSKYGPQGLNQGLESCYCFTLLLRPKKWRQIFKTITKGEHRIQQPICPQFCVTVAGALSSWISGKFFLAKERKKEEIKVKNWKEKTWNQFDLTLTKRSANLYTVIVN